MLFIYMRDAWVDIVSMLFIYIRGAWVMWRSGKAGKGKGNGASNPSAEIFKKEVKIC